MIHFCSFENTVQKSIKNKTTQRLDIEQTLELTFYFVFDSRHYQLPYRRRHQRSGRGDHRRQPQQLQFVCVFPRGSALGCFRVESQTCPVLRRQLDGRRIRRVGLQRLQVVHLQIHPAGTTHWYVDELKKSENPRQHEILLLKLRKPRYDPLLHTNFFTTFYFQLLTCLTIIVPFNCTFVFIKCDYLVKKILSLKTLTWTLTYITRKNPPLK